VESARAEICQETWDAVVEQIVIPGASNGRMHLEDAWKNYRFKTDLALKDFQGCLKTIEAQFSQKADPATGLLHLRLRDDPSKEIQIGLEAFKRTLATTFKDAGKERSTTGNMGLYELLEHLAAAVGVDPTFSEAHWNLSHYYKANHLPGLALKHLRLSYDRERDPKYKTESLKALQKIYKEGCVKIDPEAVNIEAKPTEQLLADVQTAIGKMESEEEELFRMFTNFRQGFFSPDCKVQGAPLSKFKYGISTEAGPHGNTLYFLIKDWTLDAATPESVTFKTVARKADSVRGSSEGEGPKLVDQTVTVKRSDLKAAGATPAQVCTEITKALKPFLTGQGF
jgi:hypothetical protein